ncbi:amidohydrolase [Rhizobium sp. C4]|uniref:amidohydrolase n=1 Tax=Rhizobium sp. C4 TaxID=1349800 RepID=UPI001E5FD57D|nr:amidohydrolase [Rhizobium sp. C4]MCD2175498.1 amidohydrolase [Rhizobium sp. C4]
MGQPADIVIRNGNVITMDDALPRGQAVAIAGNRIIKVGSDAEAMELAGPSTRVIDAAGGTILPGFNESHMHIFGGSLGLTQLSLIGIRGEEALRKAITAYAAENPDLPLLVCNSADYVIFGDAAADRHRLDAISPDRPLLLIAPDHHTGWANTAALKAAGILNGKSLGVGNEIVMAADGLASGELRENEAMGPVLELGANGGRERFGIATGGDPDSVNAEQRANDVALFKKGLAYCASLGITSFQNMDGSLYQLELLDEIEKTEGLPARVRMPYHMKNFMPLSVLEEKAAVWRERYNTDRLRCDFVKMFADGVVESGTAVMVGGYGDRPQENGDPLFPAEQFNAVAAEADRLGFQLAVHAIGSGAVREVLDAYEHARKVNGARDSRHRIEHIETIEREDVPRLAELGVVGSMQPTHPPGTGDLPLQPYLGRIGEKRWPLAFAWRTIKDTGVTLVHGTDWPVTPLDPIACIHGALIRKTWRDDLKDERLSLIELLEGYTKNCAWVEFMEDRKGILKPGYLADVVVLTGDIEATAPEAVADLKVAVTICDGRITHTLS